MLRKKKSFVGTAFDRRCNPSENASPFPFLYANPNPLPQIAPPSLRGNLCAEISDLFFSINFGWKKKKGIELCIRKAGTRTWIQMQRGSDTSSVAGLDPLLPRCYRRKNEKKHSEQKTSFHRRLIFIAGWFVLLVSYTRIALTK